MKACLASGILLISLIFLSSGLVMIIFNESLKNIDQTWMSFFKEELQKKYMIELSHFLENEKSLKKTIYPSYENLFSAFEYTSIKDIKVIIIGQDPYHGPNQAHGLSFSVVSGVKIPPSLKNIYKELNNDLGIEIAKHGHLLKWASQGVLLLNSVLSVEAQKAGSHRNKGWEQFTDAIINKLNTEQRHLVFILWGAPAQKKGVNIDEKKHLILKSVHPSPLSAYRGFFGNQHFSLANQYLKKHGKKEINWDLNA